MINSRSAAMGLPAARRTDASACPSHGVGAVANGKDDTLIGGLPASRLADQVACVGPDALTSGAASVLIGGLPAARSTDTTAHKSTVTVPCAPTVLIGGPEFAVPANFTLNGDQSFLNKTIRDLYYLSTLSSGRELLRRLEAAQQPVEIRQHRGTNGYCGPVDREAARNGRPTGSVVWYNPDYRSNAYDDNGQMIPNPPQMILGHELVHAMNNSEGMHHYGIDPQPPSSEPRMEEEEADAIGVGSHAHDSPSENSLRREAGLPARANHYGTGGPAANEPAPLRLRPGT